jgi:hypothetical protein
MVPGPESEDGFMAWSAKSGVPQGRSVSACGISLHFGFVLSVIEDKIFCEGSFGGSETASGRRDMTSENEGRAKEYQGSTTVLIIRWRSSSC